ncbi:translation initiation factor 2 [Pseudomonas sp. 15A4]|uniref:translation initiation factor 2 n=1 Tax=Pseudomonas sp. 15A4 TaxID=2804761 RepID=UPI001967C1C7|nr:translation initiation factor 2 [Pseudomonas sp. 15A4]QSB18622.1 translation initiation factor 2 [Pseudomonas sp. 15A4]
MTPNIKTVPVVASGKSSAEAPRTVNNAKTADDKAAGSNAKSAKVKADNAEVARRAPVASKSKSASQVVKETKLNKVPLDLSLPPEMVKQLTPPANVISSASKANAPSAGAKPLLPKMFPDANADPDFQMQGRLLSNEMDLQLRNEARKDVEGAALDFTFKK